MSMGGVSHSGIPRAIAWGPRGRSAAAGLRCGGGAEMESHLDLCSTVFQNTDHDPLAHSGHQLESEPEAGAWNVWCAALALVGDPDAEEGSAGRGGDGERLAAGPGGRVCVKDRVRRGFAYRQFDVRKCFRRG